MKYLLLSILLFASFPKPKKQILFIGDSLTCYTGGWQHQFAKGLGYEYTNISSVGKRTDWMLKTLRQHFYTHPKYDLVVIYGGVNDAFASVSTNKVVDNVQSMVDECNLRDIEAVVILGYSPDKVLRNGPYSESIMARAINRYSIIQSKLDKPLVACLVTPVDTTVNRSDSGDGIHLKASGHRKFAKYMLANMYNEN
jgi:lysophospholipase L1-like esterase